MLSLLIRTLAVTLTRGMLLDNQTTVADLRAIVHQFVSERDWQPFHDPKNLSCSVAIEAAELMEIFQWLTSEQSQSAVHDPGIRQRTREELADTVIYCLALANTMDIDLSQAIEEKTIANALKYPIETSRGQL
jgi:NTP pyrophosphatase (non-canonical NTP hydrolase)